MLTPPAQPGALRRISAAEATYAALLELITSDEVEIGDKLPGEIQLAKRFGVSRSILREALGATATLGLTETRTGSGTFVRSKTEHPQLTFGGYSAFHLLEARTHVEVPATEYAATRRTPEQLEALRALVASMRETTDVHAWVRLDGLFHRAIAEASGNPVLTAMVASMRRALDPQSEFLNITKARQSASDDEHQRIFEAIESGSAEAARKAATDHISRVADALKSEEG